MLVQNTVTNYTLRDPLYRLRATVGVAYDSDLALTMDVLKAAAEKVSEITERPPQVLLTGFGDHAVNFEIQVWTQNPWQARQGLSSLNQAIWWGLMQADIRIAFPQLDVHFDPPVVERLEGFTTRARPKTEN
jgi:small-conductance mechanosensitive channel